MRWMPLVEQISTSRPLGAILGAMRILILLASLLPLMALAEELPDTAPAPSFDDEEMAERFSGGQSLNSGEMNSLFLESPTLLEDPESRRGADALNREERERYAETELARMLFNRQYLDTREQQPQIEPEFAPITPFRELLEAFFEEQMIDPERFNQHPRPDQF